MMLLSEVAKAVQGRLVGDDTYVEGVSIDGRSMPDNGLYVALKGERVDGHGYIEQAVKNGAVAALVEKSVTESVAVVEVRDTRQALVDLASYWRERFVGRLIAVTGSNGKTTVKEMLAAIMGQRGPTLATPGNLNNELGVPLTLLRIRPGKHQYAVIEMGANHVGEIKRLCEMARPDVALINNVGRAHLEGFGSIEDVVTAKSEIYQGLCKKGTAIINADDAFVHTFIDNAKPHQYVSFSRRSKADVTGELLGISDKGMPDIRLITALGEVDVQLPLLGEHNVMNALAAATTALAAGAELSDIKQGLEKVQPVPGRLNVKFGLRGMLVIDDTYNANPSSCAVALAALGLFSNKKVFVLGDMGELGKDERALHGEVGRMACAEGINDIFTLGELAQHAADAFSVEHGHKFFDINKLIDELLVRAESGELTDAAILVKGSRFMGMERVVNAITKKMAGAGNAGGMSSNSALMASN